MRSLLTESFSWVEFCSHASASFDRVRPPAFHPMKSFVPVDEIIAYETGESNNEMHDFTEREAKEIPYVEAGHHHGRHYRSAAAQEGQSGRAHHTV
ncbi:hypothetical protein [Trinickia soli]|uniref:hypothetical protein n=1 Tax=Trinickia soli TaxID=380675 RepID=UPI003FA37202